MQIGWICHERSSQTDSEAKFHMVKLTGVVQITKHRAISALTLRTVLLNRKKACFIDFIGQARLTWNFLAVVTSRIFLDLCTKTLATIASILRMIAQEASIRF